MPDQLEIPAAVTAAATGPNTRDIARINRLMKKGRRPHKLQPNRPGALHVTGGKAYRVMPDGQQRRCNEQGEPIPRIRMSKKDRKAWRQAMREQEQDEAE